MAQEPIISNPWQDLYTILFSEYSVQPYRKQSANWVACNTTPTTPTLPSTLEGSPVLNKKTLPWTTSSTAKDLGLNEIRSLNQSRQQSLSTVELPTPKTHQQIQNEYNTALTNDLLSLGKQLSLDVSQVGNLTSGAVTWSSYMGWTSLTTSPTTQGNSTSTPVPNDSLNGTGLK